jgi:type II secretory pathway component PulF
MIDKIKNFVTEKPAIAVAIAVGVVVILWKVVVPMFRKK